MKLCFFFVTCRSTTSPGTQFGTKVTMSLMRTKALPSAATPVMVMFSKTGKFFFLPIIIQIWLQRYNKKTIYTRKNEKNARALAYINIFLYLCTIFLLIKN